MVHLTKSHPNGHQTAHNGGLTFSTWVAQQYCSTLTLATAKLAQVVAIFTHAIQMKTRAKENTVSWWLWSYQHLQFIFTLVQSGDECKQIVYRWGYGAGDYRLRVCNLHLQA